MTRFTRLIVTAALCAAGLVPARALAQSPVDARIAVAAIANGAGAGHESAIVITALPEGATLQHITVQVRDGRQQVVQVIQGDGHSQSQVAITAPAVFQGQQLRVHAQVHAPGAPGGSVVNVFADAGVTSSTAQATVDASGGTISVPGGGAIEIPQGALDSSTTIEVRVSTAPGPQGVAPLSPVYEFLPEGLLFARPVTVSLPVPAGVTSATVYWSRLSEPGYDPIGGTVSGSTITAQTVHFSTAMVGQASSTRTVTGVGQITWISASTRVNEPIDFSTQGIEALVPDGSGSLTSYPGTGGLGTFTIPNVPDGEYILHSGQQYIVTSSNTPDLGSLRGGRPISQRTQVTQNTFLTINASNLAPWQKNAQQEDIDELEFFSTEANDWDFDIEGRFAFPSAGATTATASINLLKILGTNDPPSEIHGSTGDSAFLAQLSNATSPTNTPYLAMSRVALLPSFDIVSGGMASVTAPMADVSQSNTVSVDFRGSEYLAESLHGNPNRTGEVDGFIGVLGQPGSAADGFYSSNADLLLMSNTGTDVVTGLMTYGTPTDAGLAGNWGVLFDARLTSFISLPPLPGTTGFRAQARPREFMDWVTTTDAAQAAPVTPPLSLPTSITVNGIGYYQGASGIGTTPTLSWSPGAIGQPAFYRLTVARLTTGADNKTGAQVIAQILTPNTTLTLPAGILQTGQTYFFRLYAVAPTSTNAATLLATSPFKNGLDIATAMTVSGEFQP